MIGFSQPLTDKLQFSADATIAHLSRTISPDSLLDPSLAELAAGNEYYATVQFISTNIFKDGDMYIGASLCPAGIEQPICSRFQHTVSAHE
jgi:hypothetical protein